MFGGGGIAGWKRGGNRKLEGREIKTGKLLWKRGRETGGGHGRVQQRKQEKLMAGWQWTRKGPHGRVEDGAARGTAEQRKKSRIACGRVENQEGGRRGRVYIRLGRMKGWKGDKRGSQKAEGRYQGAPHNGVEKVANEETQQGEGKERVGLRRKATVWEVGLLQL